MNASRGCFLTVQLAHALGSVAEFRRQQTIQRLKSSARGTSLEPLVRAFVAVIDSRYTEFQLESSTRHANDSAWSSATAVRVADVLTQHLRDVCPEMPALIATHSAGQRCFLVPAVLVPLRRLDDDGLERVAGELIA